MNFEAIAKATALRSSTIIDSNTGESDLDRNDRYNKLHAELVALHSVPGIKDADITKNLSKDSTIRTTTTAADEKRLLKNARRQARRRTQRLEAKMQRDIDSIEF